MTLNDQRSQYLLGVREMDAQHSDLIKLIDDLHAAMTGAAEKEIVFEIVKRVVAHTRHHFQTEEALMSQSRFPERGNHHIEHVTLMKKTEQLRRRIRAGNMAVALEIHDDLSKWIRHHILSADQRLEDFLNASLAAESKEGTGHPSAPGQG